MTNELNKTILITIVNVINMKIFLLFLVLSSEFNLSQGLINKSRTVELKEFYDVKGYIFPKEAEEFSGITICKERYTPTINDVINAEKIFKKIINMIVGETDWCINSYNKNTRKYYRQYFGYINEKNEKVIILEMVDAVYPEAYDTCRVASGQVLHSGEGPPHYRIFLVNLITCEIEKKSFPLIDSNWFFFRRAE